MRIAAAPPTLLLAAALTVAGQPARANEARAVAETVRGTLEVGHADDFRAGDAHETYTLVAGGERLTFTPTRPTRVRERARVVVQGRRVGNRVVGRVSSARALARRSNHASAAGRRKVLVLLFNFAGDRREPWTGQEVRDRIFGNHGSAAAFYSEESYGRTRIVGKQRSDGDVHGWFTIPGSGAGCDVNAWTSRVREAARDAGVELSGYDHTIYAFPGQSSCGWSGSGDIGDSAGGWSWLNGDISVRTVAHELGHNFGLHHAAAYSCVDGSGRAVSISANCAVDEYGDRFDVMGGHGENHHHAWHLQRLGYLSGGNVRTVTVSGTYSVRSAISESGDVQLLRIPRTREADGSVRDSYYVDLRSAGGAFDNFSLADPIVQGVSIRVNREPTVAARSLLLDATPGSPGGFRDSSLTPGRTFSDGTVSVTTVAVAGEVATVRVTLPDTGAPSEPGRLAGQQANGRVRLSWQPASDDGGVTRYVVFRAGVQVGTTSERSWEETPPAPGTYRYEVAAEDAAGNRGPRAWVYVTASPQAVPQPPETDGAESGAQDGPDATDPQVSLSVRRRGRGRAARVTLLARATDDTAVTRLELSIDGTRRRSATGSSLSFELLVRQLARGRHRVVVRAFDASGNAGVARLTLVRR